MVPIEASKDASDILAKAFATTGGDDAPLRVPIGIEASVGFYQAIDVAIEESITTPQSAVARAGPGRRLPQHKRSNRRGRNGVSSGKEWSSAK